MIALHLFYCQYLSKMTHFIHIFSILLITTNLQNGEELEPSNGNGKKLNVVLFLAKTSTTDTYTQDSGIRFLHFVENTRVKHCASGTEETSPLESECKRLLKTGIYSLISYCRNVLGMTTAIASLENDTFSNGLRFKKSTSEDLEIRYHYPRNFRSRPINTVRSKMQYITQPEHTEVFKIRSKRQALPEIPNFENESESVDPKWDVFGIMANIKLTFFGNFFDKNKNPNQGQQAGQNEVMDQLGKVSENSLFELVKETLSNLQDGADCSFLIIILGGNLNEVCDIYSSLMQSVKHVVENTDEKNTLIVVTGACPLVDQDGADDDHYSIPVYVKGPPKTCGMNISGQLYDVPYAIKSLLCDMNGGDSMGGVRTRRQRRHSPETKDKRSEASSVTYSLTFILFCILLSH